MRKHYINLSNGVEALADVQRLSEPWSFCRLRSTTLERSDWHGLLMHEVPDDMLMHLALGWTCVLHDRGTRRPLSKTCYLGAPLVAYVVRRRWLGVVPDTVPMVGHRGGPAPCGAAMFDRIYQQAVETRDGRAGLVRARLDYFARYLAGDIVTLVAESRSTVRDGDVAFQVKAAMQVAPS